MTESEAPLPSDQNDQDSAAPDEPQSSPRRSLLTNPIVQAGVLGILALIAAFLLSSGDEMTRDPIAQRRLEDMQDSLRQVIPPEVHDNDLLADSITLAREDMAPIVVYRARRDGRITAVAFGLTAQGYSGDISLVLGVDTHGTLLGARVLSHTETPGLGDKVESAKDDWILRFTGLSLGDPPEKKWKVKKDGGVFDQFSGATITPRAVVKGVKEGLVFFRNNRDRILSDETQTKPRESEK
jgi:electron transport complex protein RnfG